MNSKERAEYIIDQYAKSGEYLPDNDNLGVHSTYELARNYLALLNEKEEPNILVRKEITITVSGTTASGKTTIAERINSLLRGERYTVDLEVSEPKDYIFPRDSKYDREEFVKNTTKILIKEKQVLRKS